MAKWRGAEEDGSSECLKDFSEKLSEVVDGLAEAIGVFGELPEDFVPKGRFGASPIEMGAKVVLRESFAKLYEGLFENMETELEVVAMVGKNRVCAVTEDGQRWVGPVTHVRGL